MHLWGKGMDGIWLTSVHKRQAAWWCSSIVVAGLEGDICGCTFCLLPRCPQRVHLCMRHACLRVVALANHGAILDDDAAHCWVRVGLSQAARRHFQGASHIGLVFIRDG
jgi:hypothetical protein